LPFFFHFISNLVKKLPDIKSKNKSKKKLSLELLANFILLYFVKRNYLKGKNKKKI
jgi:hypothetical protein